MRHRAAAKSSFTRFAIRCVADRIAAPSAYEKPPITECVLLITWLNYFSALALARYSFVSNRVQARSDQALVYRTVSRAIPWAAADLTCEVTLRRYALHNVL